MDEIFIEDRIGDSSLLETNDVPLERSNRYAPRQEEAGLSYHFGTEITPNKYNYFSSKSIRASKKKGASSNAPSHVIEEQRFISLNPTNRNPKQHGGRNKHANTKALDRSAEEKAIIDDYMLNCDDIKALQSYSALAEIGALLDDDSEEEEEYWGQFLSEANSDDVEADDDDSFDSVESSTSDDSMDELIIETEELWDNRSAGYTTKSSSSSSRTPSKSQLKKEIKQTQKHIRKLKKGQYKNLEADGRKISSKLKKKKKDPAVIRDLLQRHHADIRKFVIQQTITSTLFPPMDKSLRTPLVLLAKRYYKLNCKTTGSSSKKFIRIVKTQHTQLPDHPSEWILNDLMKSIIIQPSPMNDRLAKPRQSIRAAPRGQNPMAERQDVGSVVGHKALPISQSNVGHQMMLRMGWASGQGLGSEKDGRVEPLQVTIRSKRSGLGLE